ncbi:MAG: polysaccharide pyruvyl transferase family protein [Eubacteriales bacterium]|nr:polysaccharide pyruvyl transferase family protein [Eubacteriales bacterium]
MIGVCIKYFHENYGGMLQAFATVKMLESRGIDYELIRYKKQLTIAEKMKSIPRLLNGILLNDKYEAFLKRKGMKRHPEFARNDAIRMKAFEQFKNKAFTKMSPEFCGYKALCEGAKQYSAVVTGSDQLWSPAGLPTNFYNLMFVPVEIRKISYASSFGVSQIPWYQKKRTTAFLKRLDYISMRENRGSEIVKELTGKTVPTILDPVFMFNKEGWEKLIPVKREIEEPYIFAYFLGSNPEHREAVKRAAKELHCRIVALRHLDQYVADDEKFGDYAPYDVAPDRFLNLLRGASYVCTDSFHGSCFSIIHKKKFVAFNRYVEGSNHSKNSRIDSLCENLGLQSRRFTGVENLPAQLDMEIDYSFVNANFERIKKKTDMFLAVALDGVR